jgi:quercetin dioxygenase-like cupin family protein
MKLVADYGLINDDINLSFLEVKKGGGMKVHTEPCFVFTYVLKGKIKVEFDGSIYEVKDGDVIYYDGSFPHNTKALEHSHLINIYIKKSD